MLICCHIIGNDIQFSVYRHCLLQVQTHWLAEHFTDVLPTKQFALLDQDLQYKCLKQLQFDMVSSIAYEIYSDKEAMKYRGSKAMESIEDAKTYVDNKSLLDGPVLTTRKAVELLETEELIGSVMYRFDDRKKEDSNPAHY